MTRDERNKAGAIARMAALTPTRRREIATQAANVRWTAWRKSNRMIESMDRAQEEQEVIYREAIEDSRVNPRLVHDASEPAKDIDTVDNQRQPTEILCLSVEGLSDSKLVELDKIIDDLISTPDIGTTEQ